MHHIQPEEQESNEDPVIDRREFEKLVFSLLGGVCIAGCTDSPSAQVGLSSQRQRLPVADDFQSVVDHLTSKFKELRTHIGRDGAIDSSTLNNFYLGLLDDLLDLTGGDAHPLEIRNDVAKAQERLEEIFLENGYLYSFGFKDIGQARMLYSALLVHLAKESQRYEVESYRALGSNFPGPSISIREADQVLLDHLPGAVDSFSGGTVFKIDGEEQILIVTPNLEKIAQSLPYGSIDDLKENAIANEIGHIFINRLYGRQMDSAHFSFLLSFEDGVSDLFSLKYGSPLFFMANLLTTQTASHESISKEILVSSLTSYGFDWESFLGKVNSKGSGRELLSDTYDALTTLPVSVDDLRFEVVRALEDKLREQLPTYTRYKGRKK